MKLDFDAIVIGSGIAGLYQLYKLREIGMKVRVFEEGKGVGGTWCIFIRVCAWHV